MRQPEDAIMEDAILFKKPLVFIVHSQLLRVGRNQCFSVAAHGKSLGNVAVKYLDICMGQLVHIQCLCSLAYLACRRVSYKKHWAQSGGR